MHSLCKTNSLAALVRFFYSTCEKKSYALTNREITYKYTTLYLIFRTGKSGQINIHLKDLQKHSSNSRHTLLSLYHSIHSATVTQSIRSQKFSSFTNCGELTQSLRAYVTLQDCGNLTGVFREL